jgi:signal transduction histidine kinase
LKGHINIKACYDDDLESLVVHIEDTGTGISEEDIPKLFTRFGKLHRTAEINSAGIGLGLLIVK